MKNALSLPFFAAVLILVLFLLPQGAFAQQQRKIREITPVGTPPAQRASSAKPAKPAKVTQTAAAEKSASEALNLADAPKDKETAIRDSVSATELAWAFFDKKKYAKAQEWFTLALEWYPGNLHAAEGLVMTMFEAGDPQTAYYVARELNEKIPGIKKLVVESTNSRARALLGEGRIAEARAMVSGFPANETGFATVFSEVETAAQGGGIELATVNGGQAGKKVKMLPQVSVNDLLTHAKGAMQEGRYRVSQWYLGQAEARKPLSREYLKVKAWNFYHTREFEQGAAIFEKLYRNEEDLECAEGLSFCLQQGQEFDKLTTLSDELGGMLVSTAGPMIQSARKQRARKGATDPKMVARRANQPLPQYAPTAALEAAGERGAVVKPITEQLQAKR